MKIRKIETFRVPPRWMFLKIETDEGLVGWGEPVVEGRARTVETAVHELFYCLEGKDPTRINDLWQTMYRAGFYRGGAVFMSAIAGIDQALWDLKGKALGVPVYQLLGGLVRDRMKVYAWVGGDRPAEVVANIRRRRAEGLDTFKMNASEEFKMISTAKDVDQVVARMAQVHEAFGTDVNVALDFHGRVHLPMAKVLMRALEPYRPLFIEEPVLPELAEEFPRLAAHSSLLIATGERMYSRFEFKNLLAAGGVAIIQPDLSHAGGLTECLKIAAMAEAYDVACAPHCPLGPVALASCLALDFVSYNAMIQEQSLGIHYNEGVELLDYVVNKEDFALDQGTIKPLPKPGLGVVLDEAKIRQLSQNAPDWKNPIWRHADGSVAEW